MATVAVPASTDVDLLVEKARNLGIVVVDLHSAVEALALNNGSPLFANNVYNILKPRRM